MPGAPRFGTVSHVAGATFNGVNLNENFGVSVASAGDVDNDGTPDLIIGADLDDVAGMNSGSVRVVSGATGATLHTFLGDAAQEFFGHSVASAGDVDNDGHADLIVGAYVSNLNGAQSGIARVYSGATGAILDTFIGDSVGDRFGVSVAPAGDVDGDGQGDFIVGAYLDDNAGVNSGSARVISGATGATLHTFNGLASADQFGFSVASAGDVDGDGNADLIVGSPLSDTTGTNAGAARVFSGATGALLHTFVGERAADNFGVSVASAGDVDGDGRADLIVGADLADNTGLNSGAARVLSGATGAVLFTFNGSGADDRFGTSVAAAGDVDGDGVGDLIVGAPEDDTVAGGAVGSARVISGATGVTIATFEGDDPGDNFGFSVASAGDLNGDGLADLIVGADDDGTNGPISGSARVFLSQRASLLDNAPVFTEGGAAVVLDDDVVIADPELDLANSYAGATLTLARVGGAVAEDVFAGSGGVVFSNGAVLISSIAIGAFTQVGGRLEIAFNAQATSAFVGFVLRSLTYSNSSDAPPAAVDVEVTFTDGDPVTPQSVTGVISVAITAVDDPALAQGDALATGEATVLVGSVFADNGAGPDFDPDLTPLAVAAINGSAASVGVPLILPSGAALTLNADGTFSYDPPASYQSLGGPLSGASNTSAIDSFTYTLSTGETATVTVTVQGEDSTLDMLQGTGGIDTLRAGVGNDSLFGGLGDDTLDGGAGDDLLDGGGGRDTADYAAATSGVTARLNLGRTTNDGQGGVDILTAIENLVGSAFADVLVGDAGANSLTGGGGFDVLLGLDGADQLRGGAGANNQLQGGLGDDVYIVEAADTIVELAGQGRDEVRTTRASLTLAANLEALIFTGTGAFTGTGNDLDNTIQGGAGADILSGAGGRDLLIGGAGADTLRGGAGVSNQLQGGLGDDTYVLEAVGDTISEAIGAGTDTARVAFSQFLLAANVESAVYTGTGNFAATGNALANVITGGAGLDTLVGGGGDDTLNGGLGRDLARMSGASADYLIENLGGGRYRVTDSVAGRDGVDVLTGIEAVRFADGVTTTLGPAASLFAEAAPIMPDDALAVRIEVRGDGLDGWLF